MTFPCTKCGACCRRAHLLKDLKDLIVDGKCKHLSGNLCAIYDSRPEYCRIDSNHMGMGSPDYYRLTGIICNLWAVEDGLGEQIDIDQFRSQT